MDGATVRDRFLEHMDAIVPGLRVVRKRDSRFMQVLNIILFFVPGFMERYTTTIGKTVYLSDRLWDDTGKSCLPTMAHEARHAYDFNWMSGVFFGVVYLFPQWLAFLALLAIPFSVWWLTALAALAPLPAWGRVALEYRGYEVTVNVVAWLYGRAAAKSQIDWCKSQFVGPAYYFMGWPWWHKIRTWMLESLDEKRDSFLEHVHDFIEKEGERKWQM